MGSVKQVPPQLNMISLIRTQILRILTAIAGTRKGSSWIPKDGESQSLEEFIFKLDEFIEEQAL